MKFSVSWLKKHLDTQATVEQLTESLNTVIGLEVEGVEDKSKALEPFVIAKVVSAEPHPDSDHLQVLSVDNGSGENLQVVCGAPNAKAGMWGVFAGAGVYVPGIDFTLSKVKIRGVESNGMMCSEKELCLSDNHEGIIELEGDFTAGESYVERFAMADPVIDVEITPNRGDCCGVRGMAREFAAAGLGTLKSLEISEVKSEFSNPISVSVEDENDCPLFVGRYVKGVKNGQASEEMQKQLSAVGAKTISSLVDITNYSTFDINRPLHVFDADKIAGNLVVRKAKDGETMVGLDDIEYKLDSTMIVIADDNGVQSIAGVMGGKDTSVDENTTNVYIECALFDSVSVAYTGRKTGIQSDARYRFERKLDAAFAKTDAIEYATQMIIDLCGGAASEIFVAGNTEIETRTMEYDPQRCLTLGGVDIAVEKQIQILESLEFGIAQEGNMLNITIPSWRNDIGDGGMADIVEEVVRIYGLANIPSVPLLREPGVNTPKVSDKKQKEMTARRSLASQGVNEAVTFTFVDEKLADMFGGVKDSDRIVNPISSDLGVLRPSGLINLLTAVQRNQSRGLSNVALFETGPVFRKEDKEQTVEISGLLAGFNNDKHWLAESRDVDVFDIKSVLETLMQDIGAPTGKIINGALDYYHPGRSGTIALGKFPIAYFGEIHPAILEDLGIKTRVVAFEVLLDNMPPAKKKKGTAKPKLEMSKFQSTVRDFAFVLDSDVSAANLVQAVKKADKLITDVEIFDVYEGANLGENKKSLAIKVKIEPKNDTLKEKDLELISSAIILNVGKQVGGELRG